MLAALVGILQSSSDEKGITAERNTEWLLLFVLHSCRRVLETQFLFVHATRRAITWLNLFAGISFYVMVPVTLYECSWHTSSESSGTIAMLVFLLANLGQLKAHWCLSQLRSNTGQNKNRTPSQSNYKIPNGLLFQRLSSPHYSLEIILYACLLVGCEDPLLLLPFTFVVLNVGDAAFRTQRWYYRQFGDSYPKNRAILIPNVW
jgi:hypothetical protein